MKSTAIFFTSWITWAGTCITLARYNSGEIARILITVTFPFKDSRLHFQLDNNFFIFLANISPKHKYSLPNTPINTPNVYSSYIVITNNIDYFVDVSDTTGAIYNEDITL